MYAYYLVMKIGTFKKQNITFKLLLHINFNSLLSILEEYKFNEAAFLLYHFVWDTFCDWYLEFCKPKFATEGAERQETQATVAWILV